MERKQLIQPVTVLKYKKYMTEVFRKVLAGETLSLDQLARKHQISGTAGTALIKLGWIEKTDVKFQFKFSEEMAKSYRDQPVTDSEAKQLIEQVRLMSVKSRDEIITSGSHRIEVNMDTVKNLSSGGDLPDQKLKSREGADFGSMLAKALNQSTKVPSLFDQQDKQKDQLVQIASAIAGSVFRESVGNFHVLSDSRIEELNIAIVKAAKDLQKRLLE